MEALARQGMQDYFHISPTRERRLMAMYVVTTAGGTPPEAKHEPTPDGASFIGMNLASIRSRNGGDGDEDEGLERGFSLSEVRNLSMSDGTMKLFCRNLEKSLDRPVVDETGLSGSYELSMKDYAYPESAPDKNDFQERLGEQLHLAITPAERNVEMLVFYPDGGRMSQ
jgi:uncharacterized protein (TIGR03435 family)